MQNENSATKSKYNGWYGFVNGKRVFVVNKGVNKDRENILKVVFGHYVGMEGWSGGCRPVYTFRSAPVWVLAEKVQTRKQLAAASGEPID